MTKIYDLSQEVVNGACMWPRLARDVQIGAGTFEGIRSTGWHNENHPGWYDMGQPFPYEQGWGEGHQHGWVGHMHVATHVDAPMYMYPEGVTLEKIPLENLYGTGVIVDMRSKKKWDTITAEDFEKSNPKIEAGDFVVVNTGWHHKWKPELQYDYHCSYPGLVPSAAEWLIKKKVKAIAGTWPTCDHSCSFAPLEKNMPYVYNDYMREKGKDPAKDIKGIGGFEECLEKLLRAGISCVHNAGGNIDDVTGKRMTFAAWPFRMEEADGGMVRLVAWQE
jgi:kynurenine formamidase